MKKNLNVHIICPFRNDSGGTEWHAVNVYEELKPYCNVHLWTEYGVRAHRIAEQYPINVINLWRGRFPKTGIFIFIGAYQEPRRWIYLAAPKRVFISYTTFDPENLDCSIRIASLGLAARVLEHYKIFDPYKLPAFLRQPSLKLIRDVDVMYASELLKKTVNYPGLVELSPVDTKHFAPAENRRNNGDAHRFTIGRLSRDDGEKHHPASNSVYRALAVEHDCLIRIMGGTLLAPELANVPNVELLPANAEPAAAFLQSLDCFYYRTADSFTETFGRVVFEAMACALPVVCFDRGGYVDFIEHGRDGFIFNREDEALEIILELKNDALLRERIGNAAREKVKQMFSPAERKKIIDYYLR